jgi:hypothetical protein
MNKFASSSSLLIALPFLFFLSPAALAMEKEYYNFWEIAACPSEDIEMLGSVRFQFQPTGDTGWVFQAFWTGDAWGLDSGDDYMIQGKWMEVVKESPPFIFIWNDHFQLIGKGGAPNYSFANKIRIIVDANGVPRVEFEDNPWPCPTIAFDIWPAD